LLGHLVIGGFKSRLLFNGRAIFQKKRVDEELSRVPETEVVKYSGN